MTDLGTIAQRDKSSEAKFNALYAKHRWTMVAYSTSLLAGDREAAEDAVAEAYADLWKSRTRIEELQSELAWIRRLVRNKAIDRLRKDARLEMCGDDDFLFSQPCEGPDPEQYALSRDKCDWLKNALGVLNVDQREAIVLCYYEGLSLQDIAIQTGATLGTVKTRLFYARRKLKASVMALSD